MKEKGLPHSKMKIYNLKIDVNSSFYNQLFRMALDFESRMLFVVREKYKIRTEILKIIQPHIISIKKTQQWPGTISRGTSVDLYCCQITQDLVDELKILLPTLWSWMNPDFAEDISFVRGDGKSWFISITHEKDCYFILTDDEKKKADTYFGSESLSFQGPQEKSEKIY